VIVETVIVAVTGIILGSLWFAERVTRTEVSDEEKSPKDGRLAVLERRRAEVAKRLSTMDPVLSAYRNESERLDKLDDQIIKLHEERR
jgi:hypothetical protein